MARVTSFRYFIGALVLCQWVCWVQASMELHRMALVGSLLFLRLNIRLFSFSMAIILFSRNRLITMPSRSWTPEAP